MLERKQCECGTGFCTARENVSTCRACRRSARAQTARLRRKEREANAIGSHSRYEFRNVIRKQKELCFWCAASLRDETGKINATEDHLVPLSRGGSDSIHNIAATCNTCNAEKGDMTAGEYRVFLNTRNRKKSEVSAVPASTEKVFFEPKQRELCIADLPQELRDGFRALLGALVMTEAPTMVFRGVDTERKLVRRQELKTQANQWSRKA